MENGRVVIAEIVRPHGNRGEVLARSQTDVPGRLESVKTATVQLNGGADIPVAIATAWRHKQGWVLKFLGVDSIDAAERFRGADLWIPFTERATLPEGDFFRSDLIGCRVLDRARDEYVGMVEGWQEYGGPPLMEVGAGSRTVLIPFAPALCDVDVTARLIRVDIPEGLLDL